MVVAKDRTFVMEKQSMAVKEAILSLLPTVNTNLMEMVETVPFQGLAVRGLAMVN
jgi:hypothetical protein